MDNEIIEPRSAEVKNIPEWIDIASSAIRESLHCELSPHEVSDLMQVAYVLTGAGLKLYPHSIQIHQQCLFMLIALEHLRDRFLLIIGDSQETMVLFGFEGQWFKKGSTCIQACRPSKHNAEYLRIQFPHTAPSVGLSETPLSIGLGDRLSLASYGQLTLLSEYHKKGHTIYPVLVQQSRYELASTERSYNDIIDEASWDVFASDFRYPWGADGHNLKTSAEVYKALTQGCTLITADISAKIQNEYVHWSDATLARAYNNLNSGYVRYLERTYLGTTHRIVLNPKDGEQGIDFEQTSDLEQRTESNANDATQNTIVELSYTKRNLLHFALVFDKALKCAYEMHETVREYEQLHDTEIDFEITAHGSTRPLTPATHYLIAKELQKMKIRHNAFAPCFCGEFQKGIDYIGDVEQFERELVEHHAIAVHFGYKLAIHTGSDKFSLLSILTRVLEGSMHIKTSGTHWLVALKVIAHVNPSLFRSLHELSYQAYNDVKEHERVNPDISKKTDLTKIDDEHLGSVLEQACDRQVMHIAFSEICRYDVHYKSIMNTLQTHLKQYWDDIQHHTDKHLCEIVGTS